MADVPPGAQVYFTHSYAAPVNDATVACTHYGGTFAAAVERNNIAAVQFHPEKSGSIGLRILANWLQHSGLSRKP
jgi:glutamine amidotransferase